MRGKEKDEIFIIGIVIGFLIGALTSAIITEPKAKTDFMAKHGLRWSSERQAYIKINKVEKFAGFKECCK